uniref:DUF4806 domain-containing protein n=1 Tax=Anopheles funestus TaxID=62324 RepID=A0A4Y0BPG2_ANOFN
MKRKLGREMSKSKRDRVTGKIYRLCQKLERKIDEEYEAEQAQTAIKVESDSDDEQDIVISTTTSDALLTGLKMTCSDSEDASADCGSLFQTDSVFGLQNDNFPKEFAAATVMNMLQTVLENVKKIETNADHMRKEIEHISYRLGRVEQKVCMSLSTLNHVKDGMVMGERVSGNVSGNSFPGNAPFKPISNEEEFTEFDSKLGNDEEFYSNVKQWLTKQIFENDPHNRMYIAMDLVMKRTFFAECTWTGGGSPARKIAFGARLNVLKLFRDIGSNKLVTLNDAIVRTFFQNKLRNAKRRLMSKGGRNLASRKQIYKL